jgi:hypothetical protein
LALLSAPFDHDPGGLLLEQKNRIRFGFSNIRAPPENLARCRKPAMGRMPPKAVLTAGRRSGFYGHEKLHLANRFLSVPVILLL